MGFKEFNWKKLTYSSPYVNNNFQLDSTHHHYQEHFQFRISQSKKKDLL